MDTLDTPDIPMDNSRDELESGKKTKEIPQLEFDISTVNYQVSTEPTPDSSILASNLLPDVLEK
jgi:hypothetical protein